MKRLSIDTLDPAEMIEPDVVPDAEKELPGVQTFFSNGNKYILDPSKLKTQEDVIKVIKHFASRVELHVFEIEGIEKYVKPITNTKLH